MKKYVLIILCFLSFLKAHAQITKDSLLFAMGNEACEELTKKDFSSKSQSEIKMAIGLSLLPPVAKHRTELAQYYDLSDDASFSKLGGDIGMKMAITCPSFFQSLLLSKGDIALEEPGEMKEATQKLKGTLIKIVPGDFTYFIIKTGAGKSEKMWWLEYFKGADEIKASSYNKTFTIDYAEREIYNSARNEYIKIKVAVSAQ